MTHSRHDLDLLAYADGWLDQEPELKAEVEARLRAAPELAARAQAYRCQAKALRQAFDDRIQDPVPEHLLAVLEQEPARRGRHVVRAAALTALLVSAMAGGWLLGRTDRSVEWTSLDFVLQNHRQYVASEPGPQLIPAHQPEPVHWLADEISLTLRVPDLTHIGYSVVDKRTVNDGDRQMMRLIYAAQDGRSFSLFLRPRWAEQRHNLHVARKDDMSLAYWHEGPLASAIASDLSPAETRLIAQTVKGALLDPDLSRPTMQSEPSTPRRQRGDLATGTQAGEGGVASDGPAMPAVPTVDGSTVIAN